MRSGVRRLALSLAKASFFIIVFALATGWAVTEGLSLVVGLWVGFVSAWGAFRFFGWDGAAAKYVYLWGIVGGCSCWSSSYTSRPRWWSFRRCWSPTPPRRRSWPSLYAPAARKSGRGDNCLGYRDHLDPPVVSPRGRSGALTKRLWLSMTRTA